MCDLGTPLDFARTSPTMPLGVSDSGFWSSELPRDQDASRDTQDLSCLLNDGQWH